MLERLLEISLHHRVAVLLSVVVLVATGGYALTQLDIGRLPRYDSGDGASQHDGGIARTRGNRTTDQLIRLSNRLAVCRR